MKYFKRIQNDIPAYSSFTELLNSLKEKFSDQIAFSFDQKGITQISYAHFVADVAKLCSYFTTKGMKDQKIALLGANSYAYIVSFFAVVCSGNIVVPICKDLGIAELDVIFHDCQPSAFVYLNGVKEKAENIQAISEDIQQITAEMLQEIFEQGQEFLGDAEKDGDEMNCIIYTSGTSGPPKGVMLTSKKILGNAASLNRNLCLGEKLLLCLPLHHMFACTTSLFAPLMYGRTIIINLSGKNLVRDLMTFSPDYIFLVPAIAEFLYKRIQYLIKIDIESEKYLQILEDADLLKKSFAERKEIFGKFLKETGSALKTIVSGAAALDVKVITFFEKIGIEVLGGYGMTECSPVISVNMHEFNCYGSVGIPLDCNEVRIHHEEGENTGEIQVKGSNVMLGYYHKAAETRAVFDGEWLKTGDIGYLDEDGYLFISGRIKNLIIRSSGENVSPEELESRLVVIPHISEVLVHEKGGLIIASVYCEQRSEEVAAAVRAEIAAVNQTLPSFKKIDKVDFVETGFERTATNKIKRNI